MASVFLVYDTIKRLANKDQRGFVTPSVFNSLTQVAQQNVIEAIIKSNVLASNMRMRQINGEKEISKPKMNMEDLSVLVKDESLVKASGLFERPSDFMRAIEARTMGSFVLDRTTSVRIDIIYSHSEIDDILDSNISRPTDKNPVLLMASQMEVFPKSINKIKLRYYKVPQGILPTTGAKSPLSPRYGFTATTAGNEVYNPSTSVDFELPDALIPDLVIEMAKMIGINLSSDAVYSYAKNEENKSDQ